MRNNKCGPSVATISSLINRAAHSFIPVSVILGAFAWAKPGLPCTLCDPCDPETCICPPDPCDLPIPCCLDWDFCNGQEDHCDGDGQCVASEIPSVDVMLLDDVYPYYDARVEAVLSEPPLRDYYACLGAPDCVVSAWYAFCNDDKGRVCGEGLWPNQPCTKYLVFGWELCETLDQKFLKGLTPTGDGQELELCVESWECGTNSIPITVGRQALTIDFADEVIEGNTTNVCFTISPPVPGHNRSEVYIYFDVFQPDDGYPGNACIIYESAGEPVCVCTGAAGISLSPGESTLQFHVRGHIATDDQHPLVLRAFVGRYIAPDLFDPDEDGDEVVWLDHEFHVKPAVNLDLGLTEDQEEEQVVWIPLNDDFDEDNHDQGGNPRSDNMKNYVGGEPPGDYRHRMVPGDDELLAGTVHFRGEGVGQWWVHDVGGPMTWWYNPDSLSWEEAPRHPYWRDLTLPADIDLRIEGLYPSGLVGCFPDEPPYYCMSYVNVNLWRNDSACGGWVGSDPVAVGVVEADLDADTNRDACVSDDLDDDIDEDQWMLERGVIVLYNCDDDNQDSGTATGITATALTDSSKTWETDEWENGHVVITSGDEEGWRAEIAGNTATAVTLSGSWTPSVPTVLADYRVFDGVDAATDDWVDGPHDHLDMARLLMRPVVQLPDGWTVILRATLNADRMRIWANEDLDGDRHLDIDEDLNGNLLLDEGEDADGDGRLDEAEDFDGDGLLDTQEDENQNGVLDIGEDLNGNGRLDYIGAVVIGEGAPAERDITSLAHAGGTLYLEALSFPEQGLSPLEFVIRLEVRQPGSAVFKHDEVRLRTAPWLMIPHDMDTHRVLVVRVYKEDPIDPDEDNETFVTLVDHAIGNIPLRIINGDAYDQDRWIQDEIEVGYTLAPYRGFHVVLDSPRNGGLADYARYQLLGPDFGWFGFTGSSHTTSSFGNLEISPPVTLAGTEYRLGRVVHGTMTTGITDFLEAQENIQTPLAVDTGFLLVGHVDEVFSFVPGGEGAQGFQVAVASPQQAIDIMEDLQDNGYGDRPLAEPPPPDDMNPLPTIDDLLGDPGLVAYNRGVQQHIESSRVDLRDGLGLTHSDFVTAPVWFRQESYGPGTGAVADSADLVNALYAENAPHPFVAPATFGPFQFEHWGGVNYFEADMSDGFIDVALWPPVFINDWHWYHLRCGEVHCGTNSIRLIPGEPWWETP